MRLLFLNPQGNFDKTDAFWTEHPDFGGQLVYVKEIASSIASLGHQVDIVTRRFKDDVFHQFSSTIDHYPGVDNLRIIRVPCGDVQQFLNKEALWEHLSEWVDEIIKFYDHMNERFDFITTHYADGGIAGAMLSSKTKIPFSFTGHSLGAQKMDKLGLNKDNVQSLDDTYAFSKRLLAERTAMNYADVIFVSTSQEKSEQYAHHAYRHTALTRDADPFIIAPPGANVEMFSRRKPNDLEAVTRANLNNALLRDIDADRRTMPYIISASRLDPKKNHIGLFKAYGESPTLQAIANLAISLRGIDDPFTDFSALNKQEQTIITECMALIQQYNLRGKVTFVNITSQKALAASYRFFAEKRSIFTLTALYEPFGLAPIEAMCAGLPAAVTKYGGPSEVLKEAHDSYGVLLDVTDTGRTAQGLIQAFKHYDYYQKQGHDRVMSKYTWLATAKTYLEAIERVCVDFVAKPIDIPEFFETPTKENNPGINPLLSYYLKKGSHGDSL